MASSSDKPLLERLKERKLVQWALAYLAGGWLILQVTDVTAEPWGLSVSIIRTIQAALIVGFFVTLVLAWYHGEQGRQRVSGPELLIIGGLLAVFAVGFRILGSGGSNTRVELTATAEADAPVQPSVAVLPFVNMSGNPDNEYFSDGITEELLNALAQLPGLRVPGRTSSFAFKGQNITIRQIADTLDVAHVLEGSVRRDADRVLITAQLVEAQTDTHLWSDTFEREIEDIFAIQREIATAITDELEITLSGEQRGRLASEGTRDPEAHEAYLRGRYLLEQRIEESLLNAITEFQRAVDGDPDYAEAYAGLADSYVLGASFGWLPDYRESIDLGLEASRTAIELDPTLGMALPARGFGLWNLGEWEEAERAFEEALELSPQNVLAHQWYGLLLATTGRAAEGVIEAERALELDPVYRQVHRNLAWTLEAAGRVEDAVERSREMLELAPDWPIGWQNYTWLLLGNGYHEEGLEAGLEMARLFGYEIEVAQNAFQTVIRYAETGEPQIASAPQDWLPGDLGLWYAHVGQSERALELLEADLQAGRVGLTALSHATAYSAPLRDDPRYQALLEEAGITW